MFYLLASSFSSVFTPLNALTYGTSRMILAALTALLLSLIFGGRLIRFLKVQAKQAIRDDGPQTHLRKAGTPTMGGLLIIGSITVAMLLWADLTNLYTWLALFVLITFGIVGWYDDYKKIVLKDPQGLRAKHKYALLSICGVLTAVILYATADTPAETTLIAPFFKKFAWEMSAFSFIVFVYLVLVGSSNAVNLTDGLDGLAIVPIVLVAGGLMIFAYISGSPNYATYLHLPVIHGSIEMAVFSASIVGAGLGFLWFNAHPAQVFMGDVGALSLGACLGLIAVVVRQELTFAIMGALFVAEALSVFLQVGSYKLRKKRIFKMAPLHHHFELLGWHENKVTIRFWIITIVLVLIGLSSLKLR